MSRLEEIKLVGMKDWWWFVVYLKRDEFSRKLGFTHIHRSGVYMDKLLKDRSRAHTIDAALEGLK